jgi:cyclic pyranopterin phosphate synthase
MSEKFIPIVDRRVDQRDSRKQQASLSIPAMLEQPTGQVLDTFRRPLNDLRISVTDRCNFRCVYCMPKEVFDKNYLFLPQTSLLSFEEITRIAKIFVAHGVTKLRLTGGEPLLRKNIEKLIEMLRGLTTQDGRELDITLTTNGSLLARKAQSLKDAGLTRVTVSLDSLNEAIFRQMNDVDFPVSDVLAGIDAAHSAGLGPIKVNMVVKAGLNDQEIVPMARYFQNTPHILRFIEYMDVGSSNGWRLDDILPSNQIRQRLNDAGMPLLPIDANYVSETAERWCYADNSGEIGFISSVTNSFCHDCSRARLSTEGKLYTCLFATEGHDLRSLLRDQQAAHSDIAISNVVAQIWRARSDRYSELRSQNTAELPVPRKKIEMSYIGG